LPIWSNRQAIWFGIPLAHRRSVVNFFMAGPELVRWDLTAVTSDGPYRLTIRHSRGVIARGYDALAEPVASI
jgi:hypothetical protein